MKFCTVTFDDGKDAQLDCVDLLNDRGVRATFYLTTSWIKSWSRWNDACDCGHEIGSHTVNHPRLTRLARKDLLFELSTSKDVIEQKTGRRCGAFAYPFGELDERIVGEVAKIYDSARCTNLDLNRLPPGDRYRINKFNVRWCFEDSKANRCYLLRPDAWIVFVCHNMASAQSRLKNGRACVSSRNYLAAIIERSIELGYEFATVSEVLSWADRCCP